MTTPRGRLVLPLPLLTSRTVLVSSVIAFIANVAMFSALIYLPTLLQIVDGVSATLSGVHMLPLVAGLVLSQTFAGRLVGNPSLQRPILLAGMLLNVAGLVLLSTIAPATATVLTFVYFLVMGVGIGMVPMVVLTSVQNSVRPEDIGAASAVVTFCRSIGAALGVAVFGSLLTSGFAGRIPAGVPVDAAHPESIAALPPALREPVLAAFASATGHAFLWLVPLVVLGTLLTFLLRRRTAV